MKKLLLIHNLYRETGGEDVAVKREVEILKKYFQVETVYFSNKVDNIFARIPLFFTSKNKKSEKQISKIIEEFNPDIAYVHNTWFEASLSIFDILKRCNVKTVLKLHNFRYYCSSTFFHKKHIRNNQYCHACGQKKNKLRIFNKYFSNSYLKSFMVNLYGIKYFKILKDYDLKIVVLTKFHQRFLIELGVAKEKINVFPNLMQTNNSVNNRFTPGMMMVFVLALANAIANGFIAMDGAMIAITAVVLIKFVAGMLQSLFTMLNSCFQFMRDETKSLDTLNGGHTDTVLYQSTMFVAGFTGLYVLSVFASPVTFGIVSSIGCIALAIGMLKSDDKGEGLGIVGPGSNGSLDGIPSSSDTSIINPVLI